VLALAGLLGCAGARAFGQDAAAPTPEPTAAVTPAPPPAPARAATREGAVALAAEVSPHAATVGDVIDYTITVEAPADAAVAEPHFTADPSPFDLREPFTLLKEESREGRTTRVFRARLALFELGAKTLPGVAVEVRSAAGETRIAVPPTGVVVATVLPPGPTPAIKDAKGVLTVPGPLPRWLLLALGAALAALLALFLWRRRRVVLEALPAKPELPYDERAMRDLEALAGSALLATGRVKEYYVRLSEIVRGYLGAGYGFDALEMTSDELHRELRERKVEPPVRDLVREISTAADLVKFARHLPDDAAHRTALASATRLVESTRPRPEAKLEPVALGRSA
jgi:hypothetical protein